MGAEPLERPDGNTAAPVTYRSLPPDLYFGTSGVGLFLAELHAVTGDLAARRTALGALRHALSRVDVVPSAARLGLFSGWLGIAFAAARVGTLLEEGELLERARELAERSTRARVDERAYDLISGRAGGIAALLALDRILGTARSWSWPRAWETSFSLLQKAGPAGTPGAPPSRAGTGTSPGSRTARRASGTRSWSCPTPLEIGDIAIPPSTPSNTSATGSPRRPGTGRTSARTDRAAAAVSRCRSRRCGVTVPRASRSPAFAPTSSSATTSAEPKRPSRSRPRPSGSDSACRPERRTSRCATAWPATRTRCSTAPTCWDMTAPTARS